MSTDPSTDPKPRRVRWAPGVILLVLSPFVIVGAWFAAGELADGDRTVQMIAGIAALCLAFLVQAVWWMFFARLSWRARGIGLVSAAVLGGLAVASLRIEEHSGEMLPVRIVPRWWPTPEELAIAHFSRTESKAEAVSQTEVVLTDGDWPQYRGPNRDGIAPDASIRTNWEQMPPAIVWKHPMGPAWSSFAVVGERAYTQEQRGEEELVVCYETDGDGKQIWAHADQGRFSEALGGDGPRGTPTFADGSLYSLGATGILNCLDPATGEVRWRRETLKDAGGDRPIPNIEWGMAGSPLAWQGKVYVAPGGGIERGVIAYDAGSGEPVWFSKGKPLWAKEPSKEVDGKITLASYAAPRVETIGGASHLLIFDGEGLKGYDPNTGELLWSYGPWTSQPKVNAAQPIVQGDRIFISTGYTVGSVLLEVKQVADGWKAAEVWKAPNEFKLKFNDAVLHNGHLYGLDEGILACYEFETGKRKWKKGRYGYGQIILLGDTLVVLAEDGTLAAVKLSPDRFEEIARVPVLDGKTWNHPAFARGFLFVRNDREGACLDLRP